MKLIFNNNDITKYLLDFSIEYSIDNIFSTLSFSLPHKIIKKYNLSQGLKIKIQGKLSFEGICIKYSDSNNDTGKFEAVSKSWYLSVYEDTYQVNSSAEEVIKSIIRSYNQNFNVSIDSSDFATTIGKIYCDMSIEAIIEDIFSQISSKSGKNYYLVDRGSSLKIIEKGKNIELNTSNILSLDRKFDISRIKNQIKVISKNNNEITTYAVQKNMQSINQIGLIQKIHKIESTDETQAKKEAEKLLELNGRTVKELNMKLIGDYTLEIGDTANIKGNKFFIKKVKHSINNGVHITDLEAEAYYE